MNSRIAFLLLMIYALLFLGLATLEGVFLVLAIPLLVYLAAGYFHAPGEPRLQVERFLSAKNAPQDVPVTISLKLVNQGAPVENLQVEDLLPTGLDLDSGSPNRIMALGAGERLEFSYTLRGVRGDYLLAGCRLTVRDHLGLLPRTVERSLANRLLVVPRTHTLPEIAIRPRHTRTYPGLIPARKGGAGVEFFGVREYRSGDPMRWINERVSARYDQDWFVNLFEQERAVDVGIILDCRTGTNFFRGSAEILEHSIQAAATLAESFLNFGNRVGLLVYGAGRIWVQPGYGKVQRERILQALATVILRDRMIDKELAYLPTRLFPAHCQLVLVSSLLLEDLPTLISLRAHGYPLLIISPDAIEFERKLLGDDPSVSQGERFARLERDFMLQQLRRAGARLFEWQVDQPFHLAARYPLSQAAFWRTRQGGRIA